MRKISAPSPIRVEGKTAYIFLKEGYETVIDATDIPLVKDKKWRLQTTKKRHCYVVSGQSALGNFITLHRFLLSPPSSLKIDHKDGDGLNNRRRNLRQATGSQNNANSIVSKRNKLGIKGVKINGHMSRFRAVIRASGKMKHLGYFDTAEEASTAYMAAAKTLWGEFAKK